MEEIEQHILKLRASFHKQLAKKIGLNIDEIDIDKLVNQTNDKDLFNYLESKLSGGETPERSRMQEMINQIRNSKIYQMVMTRFMPKKRKYHKLIM